METALWLVFYFIFGLIVGSFLNVLVLRYGTGKTMLGRSVCLSCDEKLRVKNLIPVLSFLFQRGRCSECRSKISAQYPIVELVTGVLFATIFYVLGETSLDTLFHLVFFSILIAITTYDIHHKIIPDGLVIILATVAVLRLVVSYFAPNIILVSDGVLSHLASGGLLFTFFFILWFVSRGRWMGLGDGKLALAIGIWVPLQQGVWAIMISFWMGALFGILLIIASHLFPRSHYFTMKSEIPFAPFIVLGFLITFITPINVYSFLQF